VTDLTKRVKRRSHELKRDRGRLRRIVVTLYPSGLLGLRLERTRREEVLPFTAAYDVAVKMRVASERAEKARKRAEKRNERRR
jgi:hypothetical protein